VPAHIDNMSVRDLMLPTETTLHPNDSVAKALDIMTRSSSQIVPIVNNNGSLAGVVSIERLRNIVTGKSSIQTLKGA
jgi:CBS domain-containing protein